ncbi:MAG TPA: hypothetical protein VN922_00370 [Bacteroidia bacterium]|nr:hypothetical protein [Bacteroidia bacterium]
MPIKTALLSCLTVALAMVAQAQQSDTDTALPDYFRDLPHYNLPGIPDSHFMPDSSHQFLLAPPQREHYFLYKPDPKRGWLPGEYKMWLNAYYKNLRQFKKDSIEFLQYKHRRDSLEHLLDSLRRMSMPVLACQVRPAGYRISNDAIFSWHNFSAIACSLFTCSIRRRSSSIVPYSAHGPIDHTLG